MTDRRRAKLDRVSVTSDAGPTRVEVELHYGSRHYLGHSEHGDGDLRSTQRLVAEATYAAVHELVGGHLHFILGSVSTQEIGRNRMVLLTAYLETDGAASLRLGACMIANDDVAAATARAALDSANRALAQHLPWIAGE